MKAVIFGAGGQVGTALAETAPLGTKVFRLHRAECDICSPAAVGRAIARAAPDIVFNAAAFNAVDAAETNADEATAVNAVAPGTIAMASRAAGARMVHLSTDYVFDGNTARPYRAGDRPNPLSVYGRTKLAGEEAVLKADPTSLVVRTCWIYSAHGGNFVKTMLRLMREREGLRVVDDQIGTPTGARSLAAALWRLAGTGASGLLHYSDSGAVSRHEFALAIRDEALGLGLLNKATPVEAITTAEYPTPAPRPRFSVLDASEAWQAIGGAPPHWREVLRQTLAEIRAHG